MTMGRHRLWTSPFLRQCFAVSSVVLNMISCGFTTGFNVSLFTGLRKTQEIPLDIHAQSWLASLIGFTLFLGSVVSSIVIEVFGRRPAMIMSSVLMICGWITMSLATSFPVLVLGKIFHGMGFGSGTNTGNILIGEYSSPKYRGCFIASIPSALLSGSLTAHALGIFFNWHESPKILMFLSMPALVIAVLSPESPSFLVKKARYDECKEAFQWLRGTEESNELDLMIKTDIINKEMEKKQNYNILTSVKNTLIHIITAFKKREFRIPIVLMIHINALNQFCGSMVNDIYALDVHTAIYGTDIYMFKVITSLDILRIVSIISSIYIIHRLKRRYMLLICVCFNIFAYICVAGFIYARKNGLISNNMVIGICLHHFHFLSFGIGALPLIFVISGEIFPLADKGLCSFVSSIIFSLYMFTNIKSAPYLISFIGVDGTFLLYSMILLYSVVVVFILLPETKDKTLQEIENEFRNGKAKRTSHNEELCELYLEDVKETN